MDWLSKYHAVIVCDEKILRVPFGNEILIVHGDESNNGLESRLNIISCTKTQKYLLKGCHVFLAHITSKKAGDKSEEKRLEDVPVVRDFLKVFPQDLPGIPPTQQVEFQIDLIPGSEPVTQGSGSGCGVTLFMVTPNRPINYNPTQYVLDITTRANYDTRHPPSYTSIRNPIRCLVHRLLTLSVAVSCDKAKGSKRKSPIVGAHLIGNIANYYGLMTLGALRDTTLRPETSSIRVAKLVDLGICMYNGLGIGEIVSEIPEVAGDEDVRAGQAKFAGVGRHPNMSNANRLRAMDERLGEIVNDVDELTYVVSGMSEQLFAVDGLDETESGYQGRCLGEIMS
ncbi:hypothetical protein Tco_0594681 [Tanacetum coccineum]